jgi:hypothetical protein
LGGAGDTAFGEQHVQGNQQIEIGSGHAATLARRGADMASNASIKCKCCAFRLVTHGHTLLLYLSDVARQ